MSKQKTYNTYRKMYPEFVYEGFQYDVQPDGLHISFTFRLDEKICFHPTAFIPNRPFLNATNVSKHDMDVLVFNIGMIELISYWKCFCPPQVTVKPMCLDKEQLIFWRKLYYNGLGEFFYVNGIHAGEEDFMTIRCADNAIPSSCCGTLFVDAEGGDTHIVPIGGGKDSVVTLELLSARCSSLSSKPLPLIMNPRGATVECVKAAGYTMDEVVEIRRTIDPLLLDLNKQGALNGHTPFSAMLAFYTLLCSAMTGTRNSIALSNENSANESTVGGTNVNHQYSKSVEFENDFRGYVAKYLSPQFNYYSFLRPLSELQIAMLFSRYEKYFDVFKSCNVGSKTDIWCGHCAKCLFAYIILSPFITPERLNAIFGKNMLDDITLKHEFEQLIGQAETKPFECVGTVSEVNSALSMTIAKWYPYAENRPELLKDYKEQPVVTPLDTLFQNHNLNDEEVALVSAALRSTFSTLHSLLSVFRYRELFNMLAGKEILIAGYGREGTSSHALLQSLFPNRSFDVAHNNDEIAAALKSKRYDLIFKSPGIPLFFFDGLCDISAITSQSDIFLQLYGDHTVAVTGTKGKSTTTMLVYEALKYGGSRHVLMAGNMGLPLFDIISQIGADTVIVAELSCHQLEGIHRGPHVGVLLNLFQEHLDHYHGYDDYQMAKMQIALKQHKEDVFVWCSDNADLCCKMKQWGESIVSEKRAYTVNDASDDTYSVADKAFEVSPLQGMHNRGNCRAAWLAVEKLGVNPEEFVEALRLITPLEHRMEPVATVDGVTYYNDSISTIPQATIEAVEALKNVETLILGGFNRGIDYKPLALYLTNENLGKNVRNLVLFGSAGKALLDELRSGGESLDDRKVLIHFDVDYSMEEAVRFAAENTTTGKICLLSPAASSYDHYKNFEYRGRHFKECIAALK